MQSPWIGILEIRNYFALDLRDQTKNNTINHRLNNSNLQTKDES